MRQRVRIQEDKTNTVYLVCGERHDIGLMWLSVEENEYDGYDGDLIVGGRTTEDRRRVVVADARSSLPGRITVVAVKEE